MSFIVEPPVEEYAVAASSSHPLDELFERLAAETRERTTAPQMMVGPLEGRFLELLVWLTRARRVLELGTFTGWSSIAMAHALEPGGTVTTCDVDADAQAIGRRDAEEAGVADRIDYRLGPGLETIRTLEGPFDLVFIDADKKGYLDYYEAALPKLADDGLIVADNVLWSGRVAEDDPDERTRTIMAFNEHVRNDPRVVAVVLTVRDGMTLIRKRPPANETIRARAAA
ncbi:MAG TPA: class I SAM-dependent methyltransferase [Gaiellaceae bacterium]|jgi:caffeoyl-CoA O-methyltransferase|nr:class I SAM-dependent methyltransferase [Gaiellaceae bacterium]